VIGQVTGLIPVTSADDVAWRSEVELWARSAVVASVRREPLPPMPAQPQAARPEVVFGGRDSPVRAADVVDAELADDVDEASDDGDDEDDADLIALRERVERLRVLVGEA
jgi:hypothetical protein